MAALQQEKATAEAEVEKLRAQVAEMGTKHAAELEKAVKQTRDSAIQDLIADLQKKQTTQPTLI